MDFQAEDRDETDGLIDEFGFVGAVGLFDGVHCLAGICYGIDHVPDQFPLHFPVALRHIDPHHAHGLELEFQRPDVVVERDFLGPVEVVVDGHQLDHVVLAGRFLLFAVRGDVLDDPRGQFLRLPGPSRASQASLSADSVPSPNCRSRPPPRPPHITLRNDVHASSARSFCFCAILSPGILSIIGTLGKRQVSAPPQEGRYWP